MDQTAIDNWERYQYVLGRGHADYVFRAARLEGFYLGGDIDGNGKLMPGGQWTADDLAVLEEEGRPAYEVNEIRPAINAAIGYQIHNRMDIAFRPAGEGADQQKADIRSKLAMFIAGHERLHYKETQMFADGLVEQRGYLDIRVRFDGNIQGDASIGILDPRDVIPDPDAKTYDPDGWADVIVTRWMTLDEIEDWYGKANRQAVEDSHHDDEVDFGQGDDSGPRNLFGLTEITTGGVMRVAGVKRVRIIDRQRWRYNMVKVAVHKTGDIQPIEDAQDDVIADLQAKGAIITKKMVKRVYWTVTTSNVTLFDDYSPFPWFTVLPFFPYFRRGKTRGMVDIGLGPQQILNKAVSQEIHIVNTTANSGWIVEENSLTNMDTEELEERGAQSGLVLEHRKGSKEPSKINSNEVPRGIDMLIDRATKAIKDVTVPEAMRGENSQEISGVAIQSRQFASQQQLAVPLDNLALTRHMLAERLNWIFSNYYDAERVIRIANMDEETGQENIEEITINKPDGMGGYLNDMTVGKYDVVITEVPMQITYENSQFTQALEIRKAGVNVPDWAIIKHSNLSDKPEILKEMRQPAAPNPVDEAKARLINAQADKTTKEIDRVAAETVAKNVDAQFSAIQTAQTIAAIPQTSPLADALLRSGGYVDHDAAPIVPVAPPGLDVTLPDMSKNTSPQFPARTQSPGAGMMEGIETAEADSVNLPA
jgi:hypothetical protein